MDKLKKRKNILKKTHDVRYLPEVTVTAPKKWFVRYDDKANPIYTTDYTQSQEYLQNQLPVGNTEQNRRQWAFENVGSNRQVRPGLHGDAADLAKAAQLGIGTALTPLATGSLVEASMPFMEMMARPSTTATRIGSKLFPSWSKALPYTEMADRGLMGYLGTRGMYDAGKGWYNGKMPWYRAVPQMGLSGLMMADAAPLVKGAGKVIDWAAREAYAPYDFYRTIQETTPRTTPTYHGFSLNGEQAYTGSPLFEFANIQRTSPSESYFFRAPNDIDILKLWNGRFRSKAQGNIVLPSGNVNGKFVSYGEPWQEFDFGEGSALYEFPVGPRRGPSRMATDWRGNKQDFSVDEAYKFMQQEKALSKELRELRNKGTINSEREEREIRKRLIQDKYTLVGDTRFSSSINSANQTVIPNERWNFDWFLKTPFWKYSENPISGQVQKELMMRWPEAKPLETSTIEWADAARTPQITAENAASYAPKVNWDADNWFKTISGRGSYSSEEAAELASHVPEYRAIEQRLFNEGKLTYDSNGNIIVKGSNMSPQEYIMRQSAAFQKMNPEHHYVGVSKGLRHNFENEARDPNTRNRYEVWADRKSPKNVEEYAQSQQGGYTNDSQIETIEHQMAIREENHDLHKEQLKWKLDHGKIPQENYDRDLAALEDMYNWKQKVAEDELKVLRQQKALDPLNGGKVFDITYPKETAETPIINAENSHWARIPFDNVVRDAPSVVTHYKQRPYSNELQTDQIVSAARRNGYGVTHIDNVMDTYDGTMLNETIIGRDTSIKSVLGNTGNFDIESPNKWRLYRSLLPPFLSLGTFGTMYGTSKKSKGGKINKLKYLRLQDN